MTAIAEEEGGFGGNEDRNASSLLLGCGGVRFTHWTQRIVDTNDTNDNDNNNDESVRVSVWRWSAATMTLEEAPCRLLRATASVEIHRVVFSPDRRYVAATTRANALLVWNAETGALLSDDTVCHDDLIRCVAIASWSDDDDEEDDDDDDDGSLDPDQKPKKKQKKQRACASCLIASGGSDDAVRIWRVTAEEKDKEKMEAVGVLEQGGTVSSIAWMPPAVAAAGDRSDHHHHRPWQSSRLVAGGANGLLKLWDYRLGHCEETFKGHSQMINSVAASSDGALIASACDDETIRIWSARTAQCLHVLSGHTGWVLAVAFSSDSGWLASAGRDKTIKIWDTARGALLKDFGEASLREAAIVLLFSRDGRLLVSGSSGDDEISVWNVATGECLCTLNPT